MKVLVDKDRLLTLHCGDSVNYSGMRVKITNICEPHVYNKEGSVTVTRGEGERRENYALVRPELIGAEFQDVRSTHEQAEDAANEH